MTADLNCVLRDMQSERFGRGIYRTLNGTGNLIDQVVRLGLCHDNSHRRQRHSNHTASNYFIHSVCYRPTDLHSRRI